MHDSGRNLTPPPFRRFPSFIVSSVLVSCRLVVDRFPKKLLVASKESERAETAQPNGDPYSLCLLTRDILFPYRTPPLPDPTPTPPSALRLARSRPKRTELD